MEISRRTMLGAMGSVAASSALIAVSGKISSASAASAETAQEKAKRMKIIDVRMRPPFAPYVGKGRMFDKESKSPLGIASFWSCFGAKMSDSMKEASMEKLFEEMDRVGDMLGVVSIRKNDKGYENEELVGLLAKYPKRFVGACGFAPDGGDAAIATIQKYVVNGPCITVFLEPGFHGFHIDDKKIFPVYEFCQAKHIPMLISYGGFHGPTDEFCLPIHVQNVVNNFPDLKLALCHACWPWVEAAVRLTFRNPNVYLSPDIYGMHSAGSQSYIEAANYMLRDKLLYGSAYPVVDVESSVAQYLEKLRPEVVEDIMYNNAARFLGLA